MNTNRHQLNDHSGYADYQHAPEEKDTDCSFYDFFLKKTWEKTKHLLLG